MSLQDTVQSLDLITLDTHPDLNVALRIEEHQFKAFNDDNSLALTRAAQTGVLRQYDDSWIFNFNNRKDYWLFLLLDVLEWLKNPIYAHGPEKVIRDKKIWDIAKTLGKASPQLEELTKSFGQNFDLSGRGYRGTNSMFGYLSADDLIYLSAMQYTVAAQIERGEIGIGSRTRKRAAINEHEAIRMILEEKVQEPEHIRLFERESKNLLTSDEFFTYFKPLLEHVAKKQKTRGEQGKSYFYNRFIMWAHSRAGDYERKEKDFALVDKAISNRKLFLETIFSHQYDFWSYSRRLPDFAIHALFRDVHGISPDFFRDCDKLYSQAFKHVLLTTLFDHEPYSKSDVKEIKAMKGFSDLKFFLEKRLNNSQKQGAMSLQLLNVIENSDAKKGIFGFKVYDMATPISLLADGMDNYCMSFGNANIFYEKYTKPGLMRDFALLYALHPKIFTLGVKLRLDGTPSTSCEEEPIAYKKGKHESEVIAKANLMIVDDIIRNREGKIIKTKKALLVDDVPGIDLLDKLYPDWYSGMYTAIMNYAVYLRAKGHDIENVLVNLSNSTAQKSVSRFQDYVSSLNLPKTRKKTFHRKNISFTYTNEIRLEQFSEHQLKRLKSNGYSHYNGQMLIDATYPWYKTLMENADSLPGRKSGLSPIESRKDIETLITSNREIMGSQESIGSHPEINYGRGLINAIKIPVAPYAEKDLKLYLSHEGACFIRIINGKIDSGYDPILHD